MWIKEIGHLHILHRDKRCDVSDDADVYFRREGWIRDWLGLQPATPIECKVEFVPWQVLVVRIYRIHKYI